jgi:hypothetical protein
VIWFTRYGVPALLLAGAIACLVFAPESSRAEGFAMFAGSAVAVLLLNVLYRIGVAGERDRDREDAARSHFDRYGRWPDEKAESGGRSWSLPENVITPEMEDEERRRRGGAE